MAISFISDQDLYAQITEGCRQKRIALEMTQNDLALRSGLSSRTIKGFETGQPINMMSLMKIMRALGEFMRLHHLIIEAPISAKSIFIKDQAPAKRRVRRATS